MQTLAAVSQTCAPMGTPARAATCTVTIQLLNKTAMASKFAQSMPPPKYWAIRVQESGSILT